MYMNMFGSSPLSSFLQGCNPTMEMFETRICITNRTVGWNKAIWTNENKNAAAEKLNAKHSSIIPKVMETILYKSYQYTSTQLDARLLVVRLSSCQLLVNNQFNLKFNLKFKNFIHKTTYILCIDQLKITKNNSTGWYNYMGTNTSLRRCTNKGKVWLPSFCVLVQMNCGGVM